MALKNYSSSYWFGIWLSILLSWTFKSVILSEKPFCPIGRHSPERADLDSSSYHSLITDLRMSPGILGWCVRSVTAYSMLHIISKMFWWKKTSQGWFLQIYLGCINLYFQGCIKQAVTLLCPLAECPRSWYDLDWGTACVLVVNQYRY